MGKPYRHCTREVAHRYLRILRPVGWRTLHRQILIYQYFVIWWVDNITAGRFALLAFVIILAAGSAPELIRLLLIP